MRASPHIPLQCFTRCGMHMSGETVTRGTCDLTSINYCLRARVNAGSARNQSCFTTAEPAIEWACVPARWAQRRRGWGDSREQVNWQSFVSDSEAVERWDIARYKCTNSIWMVDMAA